ncbi:DUF4893 domain-containing protein [Xanthomonas vesicatoria]|uniref:DUF4893 domain-containing protein n=1 Tax=Xanthomonas vesicatoria TaxID=56460 RepID=A0AAJ0IU37_9XANT|nr:DUF4893 domain-containing protein [Xanthomonas vesicatoria]APO96558.1 DUF4893 domain-containing protein [Xanthomonas vesicatoria]KHM90233.1 hypothetical protein OR61_22585 [Xanthomonas vesicatoria]KHM91743.1 hypothetical protein OR60_18720 [Xanthomonas vesicatoria]MCC8622028.1 DUF4893 domain-containing protein [Xanthomonas vesicatoria]MCC8695804.1 DUF4893 domain-containing protein [Xanthomonas vesicatoria]
MRLFSLIPFVALCAALVPLSAAAQRCDWNGTASDADRAAVTVSADSLQQAIAPRYDDADQEDGAALARTLLQRAQSPQMPGKLDGRWKVRSIQVDQGFAYAYPYFKAEISRDASGYRFSKISGSQRRSGTLYPLAKDSREFAFLGASTVNGEPEGRYAPGNISDGTNGNSVGRLVALGPDELLLILDGGAKGFELYQLIR